MSRNESNFSREVQYALFVVAFLCVAAAVGHALAPTRVDKDTAMFLGLAIVAVTFGRITKFKAFGIEVEKEVQQIRRNLQDVESNMGALEKELGPGSKQAVAVLAPASPPAAIKLSGEGVPKATARAPYASDDPNKGQFGGSPERDGYRLTAKVTPLAGASSSRCRVKLVVMSTDPGKRLQDHVTFYLHPTFGQWARYEVEVKGNVAEDEITSYGAFTVGVETSDGVRLELDLMDVQGGTQRFYQE